MASLVFNWGWWHTVNHQCLSAAPGKPVCTSGSGWACFLEINALQCSWWNYYPFQMSSMAALVWSADYHKQHYSCTSAPTRADVLPEVRSNLITIMHSILEGKKLFGFTQGRKARSIFLPPGIIIRQDWVQQLLVSRHTARRRPKFVSLSWKFTLFSSLNSSNYLVQICQGAKRQSCKILKDRRGIFTLFVIHICVSNFSKLLAVLR